MTRGLKLKQVAVPRVRVVEISGVIDETTEPSAFAALAEDRTPIVFDLASVRRVTSVGVRNWRDALRHLDGIEYFFLHCRPAVVWQFNMIAGFGGAGKIVSLFLPYCCANGCGGEDEHLLDVRTDQAFVRTGDPPMQRCASCGGDAIFDEDADSYFGHVRLQPLLQLPPAVTALLDDASKTASLPLRIRKEVTPEVTAVWLAGSIQENVRVKRIVEGLDGAVVVIAQDVHGVTPAGLAKLAAGLTAESGDVHVARAPLELATLLASSPSRLPIVSLWMPLRCGACEDLQPRELDHVQWRALRNGIGPACARCGTATEPEDPRARSTLPSIKLVATPPPIARYLAGHGVQQAEAAEPPRRRSRSTSLPPLQLDGYEIISRLGVGGMAEVMLARQVGPHGFNKLVAIKRILPAFATDPQFVDMFLREARIAAHISHPNVVQIYDLRDSGTDYYIVMEYVAGWNLDVVLKTAHQAMLAIPIEIACRVVSDMCAGLHAAHTAVLEDGRKLVVVHRDVSPHNVLVAKTGSVKLTDFGIAKATNNTAVTKTEGLKGKFMYMAPERFDGVESDVRSDVFSAGLVLFLTLTQMHPFQASTELSSWENAIRADVPSASMLRSDLPPELDAILARAVARDRNARFQTAEELHLALEGFLSRSGRAVTAAHVARWLADVFAATAQTEPDPLGLVRTTPGFVRQS